MAHRKIRPGDLPSNSRDGSNDPPSLEAVVSGRTKDKERSLSHEVRHIINDLFLSVVIPSTKNMIYQFLVDGLGQMILGQNSSKNSRGLPTHQSYHSMYSGLATRIKPRMATLGQRAGPLQQDQAYEDIYFDYEQEARLVLAAMLDRLARFNRVSLGDMRHLAGLSTNTTHQRYGWADLSGSEIVLTSEGWIITLPEFNSYK